MSYSVALMFLMVCAIIIAFLIMVPSTTWLKRILGYLVAADLFTSWYVITTYATTGTAVGLAIAVFAAVGLSLTYRGLRLFLGHERMAVDGDDSLRAVFSELFTQLIAWIRALFKALFNGGKVDTPKPLNIKWISYPSKFSAYVKEMANKTVEAFNV